MSFERIQYEELKKKVTDVNTAVSLIKDGMVVASSGFTKSGDSKEVLPALAEKSKDQDLKVTLLTGASLGHDTDGKLAAAGVLKKRMPFQVDRILRSKINSGEVLFIDQHLSESAEVVHNKTLNIDVAIIEVAYIDREGNLVPTTSVGNTVTFASCAKKVIIEINEAVNPDIYGLHDIYQAEDYPFRNVIPIIRPWNKIGSKTIRIDPEKIAAIVFTNKRDSPADIAAADEKTTAIASHILRFFEKEVQKGHLTPRLLPLQAGIGKVANAVLTGFKDSDFYDLTMFSEVLQDSTFDLIDAGKLSFASASSITVSDACYDRVFENLQRYREKIVLRPQNISNTPGLIRRLGVIAINTAIEFYIYGNVNSTHITGSQIMNGIGGSGDFARNSYLSIFVAPSASKNNTISHVLPMVSHVDHTEHDVDILVTDQGLADLRGLAPRERAQEIIDNCVHPEYKEQLQSYFDRACQRGGHTPHLLEEAFSWHVNFKENKTMKVNAEICEN